MTIVVTHTTPADSSFSTEGAAAWNANHALSGVGTMAEQDANNVAVTGGSINNTVIGNTTPNAATFTTLTATGQTSLGGAAGSEGLRVTNTASSVNWLQVQGATATNRPRIVAQGSDADIGLFYLTKGSGAHSFATDANAGTVQFNIARTASAVNYVQVTGAATGGNGPVISSQGSDANVNATIQTKGSGVFRVVANNAEQFRVNAVGSAANILQAGGAASGSIPSLQSIALGADTNVGMALQTRGTGGISLSTGSTGTNLVNGTTVTAITRTNAGSGYTSFPTIAISAPTTAGGVQATASVALMQIAGATIVSGGTGYTVGDVLTISGGTPSGSTATLTVSTVSAGVITAVTVSLFGNYSVLPTNPVSVTGGTGTGATFNLNYAALTYTITNAGSGYVEQPTVTFSGGGGSGAAAYATVGSGTTVRSLGSTMSFVTPAGTQAQISEVAGATPTAIVNLNGSTFNLAYVTAAGSATNAGLILSSKGTASVGVYTNSAGSQAAQFSHTASAVNYVQVTGAATGNRTAISAQGSDTNVGINYLAKGNGLHVFAGQNGSVQFTVNPAASAVNYLQVAGSAAGSVPSLSTQGSDTNIDLALTPKGTGLVRFGTYTAGAPTATGYISIKAADGTTYKVLVGT